MAEQTEHHATRDEVVEYLAAVIADAMEMARPGRLEHQAAIDALRALAGGSGPPPGLDARPHLRWTIHCSQCGAAYREPEYEQVATWPTECLATLGDYGLHEQDWCVNEFEGRPLVCPRCECVAWCEECGEEIRAWESHWHREDANTWYHTGCAPELEALLGVTTGGGSDG